MKIDFTKAVASGNDFILLDNRANRLKEKIKDLGSFAKFASRRKYSAGSDGVLVLEDSENADFKMRIFNPDGSEVTMCGNGIRCSALYAYKNGWCKSSMRIETGAGVLEASVDADSVKMKMPEPRDIRLNQNIGLGKTVINIHTIYTGVPHAVHFVNEVARYPVKEVGQKLRYHKVFEPEGTNADFVQVRDESTIFVRTYERGVEDETLACGTGVVASAIISHLVNGTREPVNAVTKGKEVLKVYFKKEIKSFKDVYLEGKAQIVYDGGIYYV